jgi:streptomycin 6-kinase
MPQAESHSVSWARLMSVPQLAGAAIAADTWVGELAPRAHEDDHHALMLERARERRRIALDELVRRGAIESYSFV